MSPRCMYIDWSSQGFQCSPHKPQSISAEYFNAHFDVYSLLSQIPQFLYFRTAWSAGKLLEKLGVLGSVLSSGKLTINSTTGDKKPLAGTSRCCLVWQQFEFNKSMEAPGTEPKKGGVRGDDDINLIFSLHNHTRIIIQFALRAESSCPPGVSFSSRCV